MTTLKEKAEFVGKLSGSAIVAEQERGRGDARAKTMGELLGDGLPPTEREELRKAMRFKVRSRDGEREYESMDERGQRKSIETEDARTRYQSIDPADYAKVQKALEKIIRMKEKMLAAKGEDGKPLFDEADLMTELFAPLVREGLMPENLVIDEHSETGRLLKNTYKSYLEMLEKARQDKKEKDAKATVDFHRGAGKLDVLKATGVKVQGVIDAKLGVIADKVGLTPEETMRMGKLAVSGVSMTAKAYKLGPSIGDLSDTVSGHSSPPKTPTRTTLTSDSGSVLGSGISQGIGIATTSKDHLDSQSSGGKENRNHALGQAATAAAMRIDTSVCDALVGAHPPALGALDGRIATAIDTEALVEAVLVERPQATTMSGIVGKALESALAGLVSSEQAGPAFRKAANKLADAYASQVSVSALISGLDFGTHPVDDAFDPLVEAAGPAARAVFGDREFVQALQSAQTELVDAAKLNNESLTDALEQSEQEAEEFERQLVLIDEGGEDMARQRSIAVLIGQLEKDRLDLEIVLKVGSILGSFGTSVVTLGVDSRNFQLHNVVGTLATTVGNELVPALKAAQLVMQMSVTIIQIARRAEIAAKFKSDVQKARKAGSALLPAVENFYGSKVAQQTFAKVELALQTVQLAGAICSSVPEPITMATGKLLTAIGTFGSATQDFAEQTYTIAQLQKGWSRTLDALNNPRNRRAGLDALRSNGTLSVHAVAWAATEGGDAIAREILNSCGVDAQTLADSASDREAVINYLETRLHEDIQFKDPGQINLAWAPSPPELSYPGWFTVVSRARRDAVPPLAGDSTSEIAVALKALDVQPKLDAISKDPTGYGEDQLESWIKQTREVETRLRAFQPVTPDRQPHTAMLHLRTVLADMADTRAGRLEQIRQQRGTVVQEPRPETVSSN